MDKMTKKLPIILDCDPGCDDAVAIMLAAKHPLFDLRAITATAGNHVIEKTAQNALKVCSYLGIDNVPIAAGMSGAIIRKQVIADHIHGETGLGNVDFGEPLIQLDPRHAVTLIIEMLSKSSGDITFVATGPLSNLAMAMRLEPKIISKIKQIVLIGGSYQLGNITPAAEFNIYADPEAAHIVFTCGRPLVMIGLSITEKVLLKKDVTTGLAVIDNKAAMLFTKVMDFYTKTNKEIFGYEVSPLYDPATIVYLIEPAIFKTKPMNVEIELKSEQSYGRTHCDFYGTLGKPANAEVVTDLDSERFWEIIEETIRLYSRT
jgi:ribosylpyrimidine nucleosidase